MFRASCVALEGVYSVACSLASHCLSLLAHIHWCRDALTLQVHPALLRTWGQVSCAQCGVKLFAWQCPAW